MTTLEILVALAMLLGLVGVVIPVLPGLPVIAIAAFVWALAGDAGTVGWLVFVIVTALGVAGIAIATTLPARRSLGSGVPPWVLAVTAVGVVIGFFVIPVVGALIGGPVALFVAELIRSRSLSSAWSSTKQALVAIGIGIGIQLGAGVAMIGVWVAGIALT
jgi:uncharacterized protein YqgC (DUF456 family)